MHDWILVEENKTNQLELSNIHNIHNIISLIFWMMNYWWMLTIFTYHGIYRTLFFHGTFSIDVIHKVIFQTGHLNVTEYMWSDMKDRKGFLVIGVLISGDLVPQWPEA